jgi:2-succinyl-5-enolpyruvyl-6-hydroxy-3-cyclohexene-1-carboxylate synthase
MVIAAKIPAPGSRVTHLDVWRKDRQLLDATVHYEHRTCNFQALKERLRT